MRHSIRKFNHFGIQGAIFSIFSLCCLSSHSQIIQNGVIQEYNERAKKTPLGGVELNVRSAGSTVSDGSGNFKLQFLTLKPGEKVNVRRIEKLGYEIFNKEAVEQWNINPKEPFVIIMCSSKRFKKIRDNYERVSSESYARQLKKEEAALAKLKADGKLQKVEYKKQLYELRENYEKQLDNLDNYVDRFSRIDLSELSIVEQKIIELVQQGKIDEAITKYEEQNYVDKYTKEVAQIKEVSSAIDKLSDIKVSKEQSRDTLLAAINRQVETLKLAGGKENYERIHVILRDVAFSDTTNAKTFWQYLDFLRIQNKFEETNLAVETYLNMNLSISERIRGLELKIQTQINNYDFANSEQTILELSKIIDNESIFFSNDNISIIDLAKAYFRIGGLYMECSHPEKATLYLTKAAEKIPVPTSYNLTDTLKVYLQTNIGLAINSLEVGNNVLFESLTDTTFNVIQNLFSNNHQISQYLDIAKSLTDLGQLLADRKQFDSAKLLYDYSKSIYSDAIKQDPNRIIPYLATLLTAEGILYQKIGNYIECESNYLKALNYYDELSKKSPLKYEIAARRLYNNLSLMYLNNNQLEKALQTAKKSYEIALKYYQQEPYFYQAPFYSSCISLARVCEKLGDLKTAEINYLKAQEINRLKFEEIGNGYISNFWNSSIDLVLFYINTDQYKKSIPYLKEMVETGESFITENHPFFEAQQNIIYFLGRAYRISMEYSNAESVLTKYLKKNPTKFNGHLEIARAYAYLGDKKSAKRHIDEALKYNKNSLDGIEDDDIINSIVNRSK